MSLAQLIDLFGAIAAIYAALLVTYFVTCLAITRLNRQACKIQRSRQTPIAQIRRDHEAARC